MASERVLPLAGSIILLILLVGVASASYPMFHHDQQRTGYVPEEGPQTDAILWVVETAEWADGSPAVYNGKVFVPTWPDMNFGEANLMGLVCYDAVTGVEVWTNELGGANVGSVSGVAVADGCVYLGGTDGRLYCIDEETGDTLWVSDRIDTTGYFGLSSSPLVYDGKIYALSASDGVLHAFNPDGTEAWRFETGNGVIYFTSPAGYDGKIYCAGNRSQIFCIDPATQTAIWTFNQGGSVKSSPVIGGDGTVYFTTSSRCYALDSTTGTERWNSSVTGTMSTPALAGRYIYAGAYDGLHCLDASTGDEEWHFPAKEVNVAPIVAGNLVYAATNEETGTLYAVDAGTGEPVWSYSLESPGDGTYSAFYTSSPAVSGGVLYIGAENNHFYAFGEGEIPGDTFAGWSGTVGLTDGQTFQVTPFNNESAIYIINRTSALGALDAAAVKGGFNYTLQETEWGLFLYSIGGIAYNETSWDSWLYSVNGVAAEVGAADYSLEDGDVVTYWYGPWGSSPETARAVVKITVSIPLPPAPVTTLWDGTVTLTEGETFQFVPSNNESASYTINRTTDLGALAAAAVSGGFTFNASDAWYASYGSFLLEDIAGISNEDWTEENARTWSIFINGAAAPAGLGANSLADGDRLAFYYCPADPSTYAPLTDQADYAVIITVSLRDFAWEGSVSLTDGQTFQVTPFNNESAIYIINRTSALGALDAAAVKGGFNYTLQETEWGLFLYSIGGIAYNETSWDSWLYSVNGVAAEVGAADYSLEDGDVVTYWYGPWGSSPETARAVVNITVSIQKPGGGSGGDGGGGGDSSPAWVSVTLAAGTFNLTATNSGKTYTVDRQTALGALDATGIAYTINDAYYQEYGSLFIDSIRGRANEGASGWMYQVNAESPAVGANVYTVQNGDEVVFFWSESMTSTPATSRDAIFIKVVTPASSGGSGSGSSGSSSGGSGSTSTTATTGTGGSGEILSFSLGLPAGATVKLGEWGQSISVDLTAGDRSTEQVNISGNTIIINREGVTLVITARNIDEKGDLATALIEHVTASVGPVRANFSTTGVIAASVNLNLTGLPGDGQIRISLNETTDADTARAFHLASAENGEDITAVAYSMTVTRINLENGRDIAGAVITMVINPAWVDEHGGLDAIRIVRSAEDGTCTILDTRPVGSDADGNLIFEAVSPDGLSTFGLLAVMAVPAAGEEETGAITPATTPGSLTTPAMRTAATLSLLSPHLIIGVIGVCAILLVGAASILIKRRRTR
jgi:outer membrane protein assembly factor BamB